MLQPSRKRVLFSCLRHPEDTTLFGRAGHSCHFKSQSFTNSYDKAKSLNSRLANWAILLSQYNMTFVPRKAIKDKALADFLTVLPVSKTLKLHEAIQDEVIEANMTSIMVHDKCSLMVQQEHAQRTRLSPEWGWYLSHLRITSFLVRSHWQNLTPIT